MAVLEPKKLPMTVGGAKSAAKNVVGTGYSALLLAAGVGAALFALPYVSRVPVLGGLVNAGASAFRPGAQSDGFGGY